MHFGIARSKQVKCRELFCSSKYCVGVGVEAREINFISWFIQPAPSTCQSFCKVCFLRQNVESAIANAARGSGAENGGDERSRSIGDAGIVRRVVVQPHLLFRGHVEEQVTAAVDRGRREHPEIEWVQVQRLGADPLVARALIERAAAAEAFPAAFSA